MVSQHEAPQLSAMDVAHLAGQVLDEVGTVVVGKRDSLRLVLAGILAFVTWVMGVPIPGLSQFGIQQPTSPFGP